MKILLFRDIVNYDKEAEINERGEEKEKMKMAAYMFEFFVRRVAVVK